MKNTLVFTTVILGCTVALLLRLANNVSFNPPDLFAVIGGAFTCSLALIGFSDYARKPPFRCRSADKATPQTATPATSADIGPASAWTYTTFA